MKCEVEQETSKTARKETAEPSTTVSEYNLASRKHMFIYKYIYLH